MTQAGLPCEPLVGFGVTSPSMLMGGCMSCWDMSVVAGIIPWALGDMDCCGAGEWCIGQALAVVDPTGVGWIQCGDCGCCCRCSSASCCALNSLPKASFSCFLCFCSASYISPSCLLYWVMYDYSPLSVKLVPEPQEWPAFHCFLHSAHHGRACCCLYSVKHRWALYQGMCPELQQLAHWLLHNWVCCWKFLLHIKITGITVIWTITSILHRTYATALFVNILIDY